MSVFVPRKADKWILKSKFKANNMTFNEGCFDHFKAEKPVFCTF